MDTTGSVISKFKFNSYKIDEFNFSMSKHISLLASEENIIKNSNINIGISQPVYFKKTNSYISGIECAIKLLKNDVPIVDLKAKISGIFSIESSFEEPIAENIVKVQFPTILFPYLRSVITSFFANAGFGTYVFPLINVQELAKKNLKDVPIKIVE